MTVVDANHILRWFLGDVPEQAQEVERLVAQAEQASLKVYAVTIAEVTYILRAKGYTHLQIAEVITQFLSNPSLIPPSHTAELAIHLFSETTLDFEDCYLLAHAISSGGSIATFDKALQRELKKRTKLMS